MKKTGIILGAILLILAAILLGGWLVTIGWVLIKIIIGLVALIGLVGAFILGRITKK